MSHKVTLWSHDTSCTCFWHTLHCKKLDFMYKSPCTTLVLALGHTLLGFMHDHLMHYQNVNCTDIAGVVCITRGCTMPATTDTLLGKQLYLHYYKCLKGTTSRFKTQMSQIKSRGHRKIWNRNQKIYLATLPYIDFLFV